MAWHSFGEIPRAPTTAVAYQERRLRTALSSWLGVDFDDSRLLDTACRWCSGKGIRKFTDIRDTNAVSAFANALSLDPSDTRLLQLPSNFEDEVESPGCTCALLKGQRLCDECRYQCYLKCQPRKYGLMMTRSEYSVAQLASSGMSSYISAPACM